MKMQRIMRAGCTAAILMAAGTAQAAGGSFVCKDGFGTMKEIKAVVGGTLPFISIVNQYVQRWDAQEARHLCSAYAAGDPVTISCGKRDWNAIKASIPPAYFGGNNQQLASAYTAEVEKGTGYLEAMTYCRSVGAVKWALGRAEELATYIQDTLDMIDMTVANYAQSVFIDFGGPIATTIRLGGIVALALLGLNVIMQWAPLRVTDFAKWGTRYLIILAMATSWSQFLPFYDMLTNVPSSVGASLLSVSGATSLNGSLDQMVTSIFDFSDRAADESGFFSISLLSIILALIGALMACVAILVVGIAKIGLAMAVSLAPLFIASLLFRGTSDLFSSWAKFTLGFALIPLVLAGVMGAIVRIGGDLIASIDGAATLTDAAPFLIIALAAIFLMSQVPTMVNGLAGAIVATASGVREARQLAGGAAMTGGAIQTVARTAHPTVAAISSAVGAARAAEGGMSDRARAGAQELVQNYEARKKQRERNQARMANMGRRTDLGADFEAGQAGMLQFSRDRRRQRAAARTEKRPASDKAKTPPA